MRRVQYIGHGSTRKKPTSVQTEYGTGDNILHFGGSGTYQWNVKTSAALSIFDSAFASGAQRLTPGSATVEFSDDDGGTWTTYTFGTPDPSKTKSGSDWCELQGALTGGSATLWYIINYLFYPSDKSYARVILHVGDRRTAANTRTNFWTNATGNSSVGSAVITGMNTTLPFQVGDKVQHIGSGVSGANLIGVIQSLTSTTITLDVNASTAVSGKSVTYWRIRKIRNFKMRCGAPTASASKIRQRTAWWYDDPSVSDMVEYIPAGGKRWGTHDSATNGLKPVGAESKWQAMAGMGNGNDSLGTPFEDNRLVYQFKGLASGSYKVFALYHGYSGGEAGRNGDQVQYRVKHTGGTFTEPPHDQLGGSQEFRINAAGGLFNLDSNSEFEARAGNASGTGGVMIAHGVRIKDASDVLVFEMLHRQHDGIFAPTGQVGIVVRNPQWLFGLDMVRDAAAIGWDASIDGDYLRGGETYSVEFMVDIDGQASAAKTAMTTPPTLTAPAVLTALDFSSATGGTFAPDIPDWHSRMLAQLAPQREKYACWGHRNWTDYVDSVSIQAPFVSWNTFNTQYNLAKELLLNALYSQSATAWNEAWDTLWWDLDHHMVKWDPYQTTPSKKFNGCGYRKGDTIWPQDLHVGGESLREFTYVPFPGMVIAAVMGRRMPWLEECVLDALYNLAEGVGDGSSESTTYYPDGSGKNAQAYRDALKMGIYYFPSDPNHNFSTVLANFVQRIEDQYNLASPKRVPGNQPVWKMQKLALLADYFEQNQSDTLIRDLILDELDWHRTQAYRVSSNPAYRDVVWQDGTIYDSDPTGTKTGTADSGTTTTMVDAERTETSDSFSGGYWDIHFTSGPNAGLRRLITAFDPATDTMTFNAFPSAVAVGHTYGLVNWTNPAVDSTKRGYIELWLGMIAWGVFRGWHTRAVTWSGDGATVTVTDTGHGLATGNSVFLQNISPANFAAGRRVITFVDVNTYTFPSTATGSGTADLNYDQTNNYNWAKDAWAAADGYLPTATLIHDFSFLGHQMYGVLSYLNSL